MPGWRSVDLECSDGLTLGGWFRPPSPAAPVAVGFVRGMKLQRGAIASSVAHDSHNIVVVGVDDESMCRVANAVIAERGGIRLTFFDPVCVNSDIRSRRMN